MHNFSFIWDKNLELGIELIDNQHKELFRIGREIEQVLLINLMGVDNDQLLHIIYELRDYITYHFYCEELFMSEINYPNLEAHKKSHEILKNKILNIDHANLHKSIRTVKEILISWVFEHICVEDHALKDFVDKLVPKSLPPISTPKLKN